MVERGVDIRFFEEAAWLGKPSKLCVFLIFSVFCSKLLISRFNCFFLGKN